MYETFFIENTERAKILAELYALSENSRKFIEFNDSLFMSQYIKETMEINISTIRSLIIELLFATSYFFSVEDVELILDVYDVSPNELLELTNIIDFLSGNNYLLVIIRRTNG